MILNRMMNMFRQLIGKPTHWLSDSGKGVKEVEGKMIRVEQTVRGITIVVNHNGTTKRVCWRCPPIQADNLTRLFNTGATVMVPASYGNERSDCGTTLTAFLNENADAIESGVTAGVLSIRVR